MRKAKKDGGNPELKLSITPMIDVTFLLLIFFMLLPFRTLERKVAAFLPKDKGGAHSKVKIVDPPKISVVLRRQKDEPATRVKLLDTLIGSGETGFVVLDDRLAAIAARNREMPGFIDATGYVPHADVIRVIDSFQKAGVETVEFKGAPPKGRER